MLKMKMMTLVLAWAPCVVLAQGKETFIMQQAYAEMQRVQGQISVLQSNLNDLQSRVSRLESGNEGQGLRREVEAWRAEVSSLRRQLGTQRDEIVRDLSGRIAKMQPPSPPPRVEPVRTVIGPHREYVVEAGDTLSLISQATGVSIRRIKEMNNMKNDNLRIGQKLMLPK